MPMTPKEVLEQLQTLREYEGVTARRTKQRKWFFDVTGKPPMSLKKAREVLGDVKERKRPH
jgi:hypothetical protein